jgi:DNA processing protein
MEGTKVRAMLARAPGLTAEHARAILTAAGSEADINFSAALLSTVRLPPAARAYLSAPPQAELNADLRWIEASGVRLILCTETDYPPLLARTVGGPAVLFVLGSIEALHAPQLAMVGARKPTPGGRKNARDFAAALAGAGLTITSGLAQGIDTASHEGALQADGTTVAVCGTGLDTVYPTENARLANRIRERGTLVSEFPPRTAPVARNFPRRNRIISGLAHGTLVVEATCRSGSLITARLAAEQGRDVFAIPGSIHSPLSRGCHQLIRQGATLAAEPLDVVSELQIPLLSQGLTTSIRSAKDSPPLDKEYEMLLDALGFEPANLDVLVARTGLPGASVASMLLILELEGRVAALPGGRYDRIPE